MAANTRNRQERERDRADIARRYCKGVSQEEIAASLGMTQEMVSYDLKILNARWVKSGLMDINAAKGRELAKVDELERTYWNAWEESKIEKQITQTKKRGKGDQGDTEAMVRREVRDGNPAFLAGVQWCIERRCRLFGLDAPIKVEIDHALRLLAEANGLNPDEVLREAALIVQEAQRGHI